MKFELKEHHRNITEKELIDDLLAVSKKLEKEYVSRNDYEKNGKFSATPFINKFGSWLAACEIAGLKIERSKSDYTRISSEELLNDIINVSKVLSKDSVSTKDYKEFGKYRAQTILLRFGTWACALEKANLQSTNYKIVTDEDLFNDIEQMWIRKGAQPTTTDVKNGLSKYSLNTFCRRFGGWRSALEAFVEYINHETPTYDEQKKNNESGEIYSADNKPIIRKRRTNRDINLRLRFLVLQKDNFKCCICGASPAKDSSVELQVDHIIPWSKGGETVIDNLQTLCSKCNLGKSDLL